MVSEGPEMWYILNLLGKEGTPSPKPLYMNMHLCTDIFSDEEVAFP